MTRDSEGATASLMHADTLRTLERSTMEHCGMAAEKSSLIHFVI